jgi:hypothetical protein
MPRAPIALLRIFQITMAALHHGNRTLAGISFFATDSTEFYHS